MWHFVYILQNKSGKQYVGHTSNVNERLKEHNEGSVIATKNLRPWTIEWFCGFRSKSAALKFEKYLKSGSGTSIRFRHLVPKKKISKMNKYLHIQEESRRSSSKRSE